MSTQPDFGDNLSDVEALPINVPIVEQPKRVRRSAPPRVPGEKRFRIILEENDNIPPTGQFFSINGAAYMLRPGMEAEVPVGIINVLNDAVMDVPVIDPVTKQVVDWRKKLRFPYRVVAKDI
jgi:hypothetical protein